MEDTQLNSYIELWKELNGYLNERETYALKAALALTTVAGAFFIVKDYNLSILLYYLAPLVMILILSYISYLFRFVAILRGYLAALEEDINSRLKNEAFLWNGPYIKIFISNNIPNAMIMVVALMIAFAVIVYIIFSVFYGGLKLNQSLAFAVINDTMMNIIDFIYFPLLLIFLLVLVVTFLDNNYIVRMSYALYKDHEDLDTIIQKYQRIFHFHLSLKERMKW